MHKTLVFGLLLALYPLMCIPVFIERGADVHKRNKDQQTTLHLATAYHGRLDMARLIVSGSSFNARDRNGSTLLHIAVQNWHIDVVKLLLESGADVKVRNRSNQIPLYVAFVSEKREVTTYLANHMGAADSLDDLDIDMIPLDKNPQNIGRWQRYITISW
jgi:ankyrin repeat protein